MAIINKLDSHKDSSGRETQVIDSSTTSSKKQLPFHEWAVVTIATALILGLVFVSVQNTPEPIPYEPIPETNTITVFVSGAIENPGKFEIQKGTRIADLKGTIKLLPQADGRILNKKRILKHLETLTIPEKKPVSKKRKDTTQISQVPQIKK